MPTEHVHTLINTPMYSHVDVPVYVRDPNILGRVCVRASLFLSLSLSLSFSLSRTYTVYGTNTHIQVNIYK